MTGSSLAAGIVTVVATVSFGMVVAGGAVVASVRLAAAADAAALAAADTASGAVLTNEPACSVAARVAAANGARLTRCELAGLVATIEVKLGYVGLQASASSRAGPPPTR